MHETELNTIIEQLGLTYTATFVPTKQPAKTVPSPQLHWVCTLAKGQRHISIPYREGCAHVIGYQHYHKNQYEKRLHDEMIRAVCETGQYVKNKRSWLSESYIQFKATQPDPKLTDVLYCLVMDAYVLDTSGFEEWAKDYGYNTDSREAEKMYKQCIEQSLQFKNLIGQAALDTLREAFQDY
mgnify:CR=1 FL=1